MQCALECTDNACPDGMECIGDFACSWVLIPPVVPDEWTCDPTYYGLADGCDCGCGVVDPDCADATLDSCQYCNDDGSVFRRP